MARVECEILEYNVPEFIEHSEDLLSKWEKLKVEHPNLAKHLDYILPEDVDEEFEEKPGLYIGSENDYLMSYNESGWIFKSSMSAGGATKEELMALYEIIGEYSWRHRGWESYGGTEFDIFVSVSESGVYCIDDCDTDDDDEIDNEEEDI